MTVTMTFPSLHRIFVFVIIVSTFASVALAMFPYPSAPQPKVQMSSPEECARTCVVGEKPKTCYYHFTIEYYSMLSSACDLCVSNATTRVTENCQCVTGDGFEMAGIMTANRMFPGPAIMVCLHDYVVVDVANRVPGNELTIHWHGLYQNGYQYYDGVPYVTQCPIQEGTTFRYQFRTDNPGSHFWHAHTGLHKANGLEGAFIVREPPSADPNVALYDFDNFNNIIFITDLLHESADGRYPGTRINRAGQRPDNFLINGMGRWVDPVNRNVTRTPLAEFHIKRGFRHRFRMINSCSMTCPALLSIEGHDLTVVASDGEDIKPVIVDSITSFSAERYDFIIHADKPPGNYWIQVRGVGECAERGVHQLAVLHYDTAPSRVIKTMPPSYQSGIKTGIILNELNVQCNAGHSPPNTLCVSNLRNARRVDQNILKPEPDVKLFMPISFYEYPRQDLFRSGTYQRFLVAGGTENAGLLANISHVSPASPLLTQINDIPASQICSTGNLPPKCRNSQPCECTHVEELPLGALIEIILVDEAQVAGLSHPFHLHGHSFHVIGHGCAPEFNITKIDVRQAMDLDVRGKMTRHLTRPPAKDTYAVPNNGFTIIRFIASNPGYWLFHCHFLFHLTVGMTAVFHVGQASDLPPIPPGFPKCGNFRPPVKG